MSIVQLQVVGVSDRATCADAGVVAQYVDVPEGLDGNLFEFAQLLDLPDVDLQADDLVPSSSQFGHSCFHCGNFDVADHQVHAGSAKPVGHRQPNTTCAAGDHCCLAV
jgi:hypothetical protein